MSPRRAEKRDVPPERLYGMIREMLFREKYRIPSARWAKWDYTRAAWYFVTVCTRGKACVFGQIVEGEAQLSPLGKMVAEEWQRTAEVRSYVELDEWVVMPNHLHLIVRIVGLVEGARAGAAKTPRLTANSLGAIISQFKGACTRRAWASGYRDFAWQPRFFDHVIRDLGSLEKIRDYVRHNPHRWHADKENVENLYM